METRDEGAKMLSASRHAEGSSGSGFPGLGAPKGAGTSREDVTDDRAGIDPARNGRDGSRGGGPRGRMQGQERCHTGREYRPVAARRKTPGSTSQGEKDEGGAAKPDE